MNPLKLLPLTWQLAIYATVAVAVVGSVSLAVGTFIHHERRIGWDGALAQVAKQDAHAKVIADQATADVDACESNGGDFDVSTGECAK